MSKKLDFNNIRFYEHSGIYLPSVTSILKSKSKGEGYERWLGDAESYNAACKFRDMRKMQGTTVHARVPKFLHDPNPARYKTQRGWMESLAKFVYLYEPEPVLIEEAIINLREGFGGALDFLGTIKHGTGRAMVVLDWKSWSMYSMTGSTKRNRRVENDNHKLQVDAYFMTAHRALAKKFKPQFAIVIKLSEDGSFLPTRDMVVQDYRQAVRGFAAFKHLKAVFDWEHREEEFVLEDLQSASLPVPNPAILVK